MIELNRQKNHRWIIQKNVSSDEIIKEFVSLLASRKTDIDLDEVLDGLRIKNLYHGRNHTKSTNTMGVRFSQICFYMFGYRPKTDCFIPSPMGENITNLKGGISQEENFLVNLFSLQYPHPYSNVQGFSIYAGRLLTNLLLEKRINEKLYIDEIIWFLPFIDSCDFTRYEDLVKSIIEYRELSYYEKLELFKSVKNYDDVFSNVTHEMNYYFLRIFKGLGVLDIIEDKEHNGGRLFSFHHGNGVTFRNDSYDSRKKTSGYVVLNEKVKESASKLINEFSPFETPTTMNTDGIYSLRDWLTSLYESEPLSYMNSIANNTDRNKAISDTVFNMAYCSKYGSHDGKDFEESLKPFMELFRETCNVEIISGAGNTDLLCAMECDGSQYNMNIDAKTRKTGLEEINAKRLENHLVKHGSEFCIVISPRFALGISNDIKNSRIVTVRADDIAAYCKKECMSSMDGFADFETIRKYIEKNMGSDITDYVRELTEERYGISL